jgi:hypothetical protein
MGLSVMNVLGLSSSVHFTHIACYWKFFLLHYIQVLCQYRLYRADHAYLTYLVMNCELLLASHYIASGRTTQKTHPLPINGCPLLLRIRCRGICLLSRCVAVSLCVTLNRLILPQFPAVSLADPRIARETGHDRSSSCLPDLPGRVVEWAVKT